MGILEERICNYILGAMKKYQEAVEKEAKLLYWEVYGKAVEYKNFRGEPMPEWAALPEKIQEAWRAVAKNKVAVVYEYKKKLEVCHARRDDLEAEIESLRAELERI